MLTAAIYRFVMRATIAIILFSLTAASVISCPPNIVQDQLDTSLKQLCFAIGQAVEALPQQVAMNARLEDSMVIKRGEDNRIAKDHEFLRFGRRFGL